MKYFLQEKFGELKEVSKEDYVDAERLNGFYNTLGFPKEPATSAFTGLFHRGHTEFEGLEDFHVPSRRDKIVHWSGDDGYDGLAWAPKDNDELTDPKT